MTKRTRAIFGPAGNSLSFTEQGYKSYRDIPEYLVKMGLDCFEYQCGRGVRVKAEAATELGKLSTAAGIELSLHAPYYISLSSVDESKRLGSARYLLESAEALRHMGGHRVVLHSGSAGKIPRDEALRLACESLKHCLNELDSAGYEDMTFCPETMGKIGQLGSLEEVIALCSLDERLLPCIDFGHLNARTGGKIKGKEDYTFILDSLENSLGHERTSSFHSHFSKIEYTTGGEKKHLTFADDVFGPDPLPLLELIAERGYTPTVICESDGTQAEDAAWMKARYLEMLQK